MIQNRLTLLTCYFFEYALYEKVVFMVEETKFDFKDFNEICNMLNTITSMDVQLIDKDGNPIFQLINT